MSIKPMSECPNPLDGIYNPTEAQKLAAGYRHTPPVPAVQDGYTRLSIQLVEGDGVTGQWQVVDRLTADIEAEARQADLAANGVRYALQNRYITYCDTLRQALGLPATKTKLGFEELEPMMLALKAANREAYEDLRDGMQTVNAALIRDDIHWWDNCVWTEGLPQ